MLPGRAVCKKEKRKEQHPLTPLWVNVKNMLIFYVNFSFLRFVTDKTGIIFRTLRLFELFEETKISNVSNVFYNFTKTRSKISIRGVL